MQCETVRYFFALSLSFKLANKGGMEIAFDDSWMEEIPGQECARFGEYKDDQVNCISLARMLSSP